MSPPADVDAGAEGGQGHDACKSSLTSLTWTPVVLQAIGLALILGGVVKEDQDDRQPPRPPRARPRRAGRRPRREWRCRGDTPLGGPARSRICVCGVDLETCEPAMLRLRLRLRVGTTLSGPATVSALSPCCLPLLVGASRRPGRGARLPDRGVRAHAGGTAVVAYRRGDLDLFEHLPRVDPGDVRAQWDGHTTKEKYERVRRLTRAGCRHDRFYATGVTVLAESSRNPAALAARRSMEPRRRRPAAPGAARRATAKAS